MASEEVVLLTFWPSPYAMRVKIALAEKGVPYECKEEDLLSNKSQLLLKSNPIHQKIPVLLHNGKPICESPNIVLYIDETWNNKSPLMPKEPYERSQARFWADYIDKKMPQCVVRIWRNNKGEAQEAAKELIEILKVLEAELGEKSFFAGETFGFVDLTLVPFGCWFHTYETCGSFSVEDECPKLMAWVKRCMERESVSKSLVDPLKVYEFTCHVRKSLGIE